MTMNTLRFAVLLSAFVSVSPTFAASYSYNLLAEDLFASPVAVSGSGSTASNQIQNSPAGNGTGATAGVAYNGAGNVRLTAESVFNEPLGGGYFARAIANVVMEDTITMTPSSPDLLGAPGRWDLTYTISGLLSTGADPLFLQDVNAFASTDWLVGVETVFNSVPNVIGTASGSITESQSGVVALGDPLTHVETFSIFFNWGDTLDLLRSFEVQTIIEHGNGDGGSAIALANLGNTFEITGSDFYADPASTNDFTQLDIDDYEAVGTSGHNYDTLPSPAPQIVPEPAAIGGLFGLLAVLAVRRRR